MALYLGSSGKLKIYLNDVLYYLNLYSATPIINGIRLLAADDFILKDSNGIYLIAKEND